MRIIRTLPLLLIGGLFFLVACGAPVDKAPAATPSATPPAQAAGAAFTTSNLTVAPDKAKPGERVMVGATVTNNGAEQGTYTVVVKDHDGKLLGTKDVTLAGGAKKEVSLHISINTTGTHMIMIDKLYQNLVIQEAAGTPTPTQPTQPAPAPVTGPSAFTDGAFTISALTITPKVTMPDDKVKIDVMVKNNGGQQGTYKVVLKVQNNRTKMEDVKTQDVTLAGGASRTVTFEISAGEDGTYTVIIGQMKGDLTVDEHALM